MQKSTIATALTLLLATAPAAAQSAAEPLPALNGLALNGVLSGLDVNLLDDSRLATAGLASSSLAGPDLAKSRLSQTGPMETALNELELRGLELEQLGLEAIQLPEGELARSNFGRAAAEASADENPQSDVFATLFQPNQQRSQTTAAEPLISLSEVLGSRSATMPLMMPSVGSSPLAAIPVMGGPLGMAAMPLNLVLLSVTAPLTSSVGGTDALAGLVGQSGVIGF